MTHAIFTTLKLEVYRKDNEVLLQINIPIYWENDGILFDKLNRDISRKSGSIIDIAKNSSKRCYIKAAVHDPIELEHIDLPSFSRKMTVKKALRQMKDLFPEKEANNTKTALLYFITENLRQKFPGQCKRKSNREYLAGVYHENLPAIYTDNNSYSHYNYNVNHSFDKEYNNAIQYLDSVNKRLTTMRNERDRITHYADSVSARLDAIRRQRNNPSQSRNFSR